MVAADTENNKVLDQRNRGLHDLRISVTDRCQLRCRYCMPEEVFGKDYVFLPKSQILSFEQITLVARASAELGVKKIRLTGGEPLMRRDIDQLVLQLNQIEGLEEIALTTNGLLLPKYAESLKAAGLDRVTVSLDAMDDAIFSEMNGGKAKVSHVLKGIEAAQVAGLYVKINTVLKQGVNEHQVLPLAHQARIYGTPLRFIEYMDVGNCNGWDVSDVVDTQQVLKQLQSIAPLEPVNPSHLGEVAKRYRFTDTGTEIGLITSISKPFCGDCNRARLSADGQVYTCLFSSIGYDLKPIVQQQSKTDEEIVEFLTTQLKSIWQQRSDRYSEIRFNENIEKQPKIEMSYIGG